MRKVKRYAGFTLIELLIVVVILGIIAAIVIPQFSGAAEDAKLNSMKTTLATIRGQVQFYKFQHNGNYPDDETTILDQMTTQTDINGLHVGSEDYGPYLMLPWPVNTFNDSATIGAVGGVVAANATGWDYWSTTGAFRADSLTHGGL